MIRYNGQIINLTNMANLTTYKEKTPASSPFYNKNKINKALPLMYPL